MPKPRPYRPGWPTPSDDEVIQYVLDFWTREGDVVFDPMCGTGTVVHRALGQGFDAYGSDLRLPRELPQERFREVSVFDLRRDGWPPRPPDLVVTSPPLLQVPERSPYPFLPGQLGNTLPTRADEWVRQMAEVFSQLRHIVGQGGRVALTWRNDEHDGWVVPIVTKATNEALRLGLRIREERPIVFGYDREPELLTIFEVPR